MDELCIVTKQKLMKTMKPRSKRTSQPLTCAEPRGLDDDVNPGLLALPATRKWLTCSFRSWFHCFHHFRYVVKFRKTSVTPDLIFYTFGILLIRWNTIHTKRKHLFSINNLRKCIVFELKGIQKVKNTLFIYLCIGAIVDSLESPNNTDCAWVLFLKITQIGLYGILFVF